MFAYKLSNQYMSSVVVCFMAITVCSELNAVFQKIMSTWNLRL